MSVSSKPEIVPQQEVQAINTEVTTIEFQAEQLQIINDETAKIATDMLGQIAKTKKVVEERRKFFVNPLNEQVKRINSLFKQIAEPLEKAEAIIKSKILTYRQEQERKRREEEERLRKLVEAEQKKLEKQAAKKGMPAPPPIPIPTIPKQEKTIESNEAQVTARVVWDFEIEDETKIPREFLMVNEKAIRAAVKAGVRNIPGVRIFQREELAVKSK
jgi:adenylate kinase